MEVFEAVRTRRSIRSFETRPVEEDKLRKVLEAARLAPSAGNRQPWRFIVITDQKIKEELARIKAKYMPPPSPAQSRPPPPKGGGPILSAPVVIVGCAVPSDSFPGTEFWKIDVAIALQNLVLTAHEMGLGSCWIGVFHEEEEVKKALSMPKEARVVAMVALGYPAEKKDPITDRKPLEEIIRYNHW